MIRPSSTAFGPHRVVALLGTGGMANVYLTVRPGMAGVQKLVVVKELREEIGRDPQCRAMFLDEARLSTRLNHRNVVSAYDVHVENTSMYLTMEFLEGQPLSRLLTPKKRASYPADLLLRALVDVLGGLHYAHELLEFDGTPLNVVHRDVSPANVFITYDGQVKIVDFGVAKVVGATAITDAGTFKGKLRFAPPEQVRGLPIDRRADIFAVGAILFEIATGKPLWGSLSDIAVLSSLSRSQVPKLADHTPAVDPALAAVCDKALAVERADRYATADEFQRALVGYLDTQPLAVSCDKFAELMPQVFCEERARLRVRVDARVRESSSRPSIHPTPAAAGDTPQNHEVHRLPPTLAPVAESDPQAFEDSAEATHFDVPRAEALDSSAGRDANPGAIRHLVFAGAIIACALLVAAGTGASRSSPPSVRAAIADSLPPMGVARPTLKLVPLDSEGTKDNDSAQDLNLPGRRGSPRFRAHVGGETPLDDERAEPSSSGSGVVTGLRPATSPLSAVGVPRTSGASVRRGGVPAGTASAAPGGSGPLRQRLPLDEKNPYL